ncbi:MAG: arginine N-succinyltransferase [Myxococcales bacterium]|nr:arginine N-succinyltransferase [Myxococcales bacterium]
MASAKRAPKKKKPAEPERFLIREVQPRDLEGLYGLSRHLNSVNFPHDRRVLKQLITKARRSFAGQEKDLGQSQYMFVLEGAESGRIVGTSMVFAQHGSSEAPHIFFDVFQDERYSTTLDRHFTHTTLRLGFNYSGPTEIGALVVHPDCRALGLGKPLSFVRFLFMAMYRDRFREEVIAELMPPLTSDGRSRLWEHLGRRFTGLSYQEADKLSHTNKEFIVSLFPQAIHATLLPDDVAELIGQVGEDTKGVKKMLESVGFRYSWRIDPFDGGPHFHAATDDISLVRNSDQFRVAKEVVSAEEEQALLTRHPARGLSRYIVGVGNPKGSTRFRALVVGAQEDGDELRLSMQARKILKVRTHHELWAVPF